MDPDALHALHAHTRTVARVVRVPLGEKWVGHICRAEPTAAETRQPSQIVAFSPRENRQRWPRKRIIGTVLVLSTGAGGHKRTQVATLQTAQLIANTTNGRTSENAAADLKSAGPKGLWGFDSPSRHHANSLQATRWR